MTEEYPYEDPTVESVEEELPRFQDRGDFRDKARRTGTVSRTSSSFLVNRGDSSSLVTATVLSVFRWSGEDFGAPGAKDAVLRQLSVRHFPSNSLSSFQQVAYPGSMSHLQGVTDVPRRFVTSLRDQLADFQDGEEHKPYTFWNLLGELVKKVWITVCAVLYVLAALLPILAVFVHVCRFLLEKFVEILDSHNKSWADIVKMTTIFIFQVVLVFVCLHFLIALVFYPIYIMSYTILKRIFFFLF